MTAPLPSSLLGIFAAFVLLSAAPWAFAPHASVKSALLLLCGGLAWVVLLLGPGFLSVVRRQPLTWIAFAIFLLSVVSSAFSIDPTRWMETSPLLPQHPLVLLACLGIFLLAAAASREANSRQFWTDWLVKLSFPLCLVALYQHLHILPPHLSGVAFGSLAGNPLYLAGALLFLIPLTAWKWWEAWQMAEMAWPRWNRASVLLGLLLFLQILTLLLTQKRGPLVALVASGCGVLLLLGLLTGRRQLLRWALRLGVAVLLFLTALATAHKFGLPVRELPLIGRMALIIPLGERTGDHFRSSLWRSAATFLSNPGSLELPTGSNDPHAQARPWIGYGPDTVEAVLPNRWVHFGTWPQPYIEVSCHSSFWDWFLTLGAGGLALHFVFFATLLGLAFTALGFIPHVRFALWMGFGTGLGAASATLLLHPGFLGLGAQFGLLAGAAAFLLRANRQKRSANPDEIGVDSRSGFLLALVAGLIAHWIDLIFLFPTPGTAFLFWLAAGGVLGASLPEKNLPQASDWSPSPVMNGLFNAITTLLILQAVVWPYPGETLFHRETPGMWLALACILFLPVVCWNGLSLTTGRFHRETRLFFLVFFFIGLVLLLVPVVFFAAGAGTLFWLSASAMVLPGLLLLAVLGLFWRPELSFLIWQKPARLVVIIVLLAGAGWVFGPPAFFWLRSEVAHGAALRTSHGAIHSELLAQSTLDRPSSFRARMSFAGLKTDNTPTEESDATTAEQILAEGIRLSPFNPLAFHQADMLFLEALRSENREIRRSLALRARKHYLMAARYIPRWETAWMGAALIDEIMMEDPAEAARFRVLAAATTLPRGHPQQGVNTLGWAQHYLDRSNRFAGTAAEAPLARHALYYFQRAELELVRNLLRRPPKPRQEEVLAPQWFWIYAGQGLMHRRLGEEQEAGRAFAVAATVVWENRPFDPGVFLPSE